MTRIIEFLIALGIVAGLFVVVGLVLPSERHMSESIETNRKMTIVYDTVNSFRRFKDWNPLVLRDPKIELKRSGPDEGKGARIDYASKEGYIGEGSWVITDSAKNERVQIAIEDSTKGTDKRTLVQAGTDRQEQPQRKDPPRTTPSSTAGTCLVATPACMSAATSATT